MRDRTPRYLKLHLKCMRQQEDLLLAEELHRQEAAEEAQRQLVRSMLTFTGFLSHLRSKLDPSSRVTLEDLASGVGDDVVIPSVPSISDAEVDAIIKNLIQVEKESLGHSLQDFGKWRITHGNADYPAYLCARNVICHKLNALNESLDAFQWWLSVEADMRGPQVPRNTLLDVILLVGRSISALSRGSNCTVTEQTAKLDDCDKMLCAEWGNVRNMIGLCDPPALVDEFEAARLFSARVAEKAAAGYYRGLGLTVEDVSITQLKARGTGSDWQDFDLRVGAKRVDVKNARSSFSSPDTYVEYAVPNRKLNRAANTDIMIVGVFSKYLKDPYAVSSGQQRSRILGEATVASIQTLSNWISKRFPDFGPLDAILERDFLPGWMFEYDELHYRQRNLAITGLARVVSGIKSACANPAKELPGWILTLCPNPDLLEDLKLDVVTKRVLRDLHALRSDVGFSRPSLYLYSMGAMLEWLQKGRKSTDIATKLRNLLFPSNDLKRPLFLLDSQEYVGRLICNLAEVMEVCLKRGLRFKGFAMPHPLILQGILHTNERMTLIAYCGGWRPEPRNVKCGCYPLVLGPNKTCDSCGHLICNHCYYCSGQCRAVRFEDDPHTVDLARSGQGPK